MKIWELGGGGWKGRKKRNVYIGLILVYIWGRKVYIGVEFWVALVVAGFTWVIGMVGWVRNGIEDGGSGGLGRLWADFFVGIL